MPLFCNTVTADDLKAFHIFPHVENSYALAAFSVLCPRFFNNTVNYVAKYYHNCLFYISAPQEEITLLDRDVNKNVYSLSWRSICNSLTYTCQHELWTGSIMWLQWFAVLGAERRLAQWSQ